MSFVSYAQNFEDVMLWRALHHVERGFYVDVGAWSPDEDAVTRAFYERGWRGINIEPHPEYHAQLKQKRPRDINLALAIDEKQGTETINIVSNTGLSTLDDAVAERHKGAGWHVNQKVVDVDTLASVWERYVPEGQDVHFLKVDVEGLEGSVLRSNDWKCNRPWIVVVEATEPLSQVESYEGWNPILLEADYLLAYADGLNRFYVATEHDDLLCAFMYPPNVFDEFVRASEAELMVKTEQADIRAQEEAARVEQADIRAQEEAARAEQAEARASHAMGRIETLEAEVEALLCSFSWRVTAPLRWGVDLIYNIPGRKARPAESRGWVRRLVSRALGQPRLVALVHRFLRPFPSLHNKAAKYVTRLVTASPETSRETRNLDFYNNNVDVTQLTPQARRIYKDLKEIINKKRDGR